MIRWTMQLFYVRENLEHPWVMRAIQLLLAYFYIHATRLSCPNTYIGSMKPEGDAAEGVNVR